MANNQKKFYLDEKTFMEALKFLNEQLHSDTELARIYKEQGPDAVVRKIMSELEILGNPFYDDPEADLAVNKEMNQTIPVDDGFRSEKSTQPSQIDSPAMENKIPMAKSDVGSSGFDLEKWDKECTDFNSWLYWVFKKKTVHNEYRCVIINP